MKKTHNADLLSYAKTVNTSKQVHIFKHLEVTLLFLFGTKAFCSRNNTDHLFGQVSDLDMGLVRLWNCSSCICCQLKHIHK